VPIASCGVQRDGTRGSGGCDARAAGVAGFLRARLCVRAASGARARKRRGAGGACAVPCPHCVALKTVHPGRRACKRACMCE
jgi:hypothetical protein